MTKRLAGAESLVGEPEEPVLNVLRRNGHTSVLRGCRNQSCGTCRVLIDGVLTRTCDLELQQLPEGASVITYESVKDAPIVMHTLLVFREERPTRCELCVSALGVCAYYLQDNTEALETVLEGCHCQCTGRASLRRALTAPTVLKANA